MKLLYRFIRICAEYDQKQNLIALSINLMLNETVDMSFKTWHQGNIFKP